MLGWMQGGYNVAPMVEALELDADVAEMAVQGLSRTRLATEPWSPAYTRRILMFDAFYDVEEKMKKGNPYAKKAPRGSCRSAHAEVMESWANAEWFTNRPEVPEKARARPPSLEFMAESSVFPHGFPHVRARRGLL